MEDSKCIAVIGAGVVGLSTAVCIQEEIPSASVTIFADKFGSDTLSDGAGGLFRPNYSIDADKDKVRKWCRNSLKQFLSICAASYAAEAGFQYASGYHVSSTSPEACNNVLLNELLPFQRDLTEKELEPFADKFKYGTFYSTVITDCRYYLPWLKKKFEDAGGKVETQHISNLSEIPDEFHVIVNCSGLGAKTILDDHQLVPIRGQTIKVKAPWIKHFFYGDEVYVIPGLDYVTLGGVKDFESWNTQVNPYQKKYIWDKCIELVPSLKRAEFKWDWVGLRPYRSQVRLDSVIIQSKDKFLKVVNNYGHGGHGVTLSWGTAKDAAKLVKKLLTDTIFISHL